MQATFHPPRADRVSLALWLGGSVIAAALAMVAQWYVRLPLLQAMPDFAKLGLNSTLLALATGVALVIRALQHRRQATRSLAADLLSVLLIAYPLLLLSQTMFGIHLGLDFVREPTAPSPDSPHPGRPSPNACLAFAAAGCALLLLRQRLNATRWATHLSIGILAAIPLLGFVGYLLSLELLYRFASYNRMLVPTTAALLALAAGMRFLQSAVAPHRHEDAVTTERRMGQRVVVTLTLVAMGTGLVGFSVLRASFESSITIDAREAAKTHAIALTNTLRTSLWVPRTLASRPATGQLMLRLRDDPKDAHVREQLRDLGLDFLTGAEDGVRFVALNGHTLTQVGRFDADTSTVRDVLQAPGLRAELRWVNGYVLHTEVDVLHAGERVGHIVTEQHLTLFNQVLGALRQASESADALICSRRGDVASCAPTKLYSKPFTIPLVGPDGKPTLPICRALLGETGSTHTPDLRGVAVVAGYTPVGDFGLGLVVKQDASSLYGPLRQRLHVLALFVIGIVAVGAWALRAKVKPLLQAVVQEQQRTRTILDTSSDAFIAIDVDGCVTDWNREATRLFGHTAEQALGRQLDELIVPPQHRAAHNRGMHQFVRSGTGPVVSRRTEITGWHRDGYEIPIELSISAVSTPDGFVANAFVRDIRERQEAQQRLTDSERRLHEVLSNVPAMVGHFDRDERCVFANEMALQVHGMTREQAVGHVLREKISKEAYELHRPHIEKVLSGKRTRFEGHEVRNGRPSHYQVNLVPEQNAGGEVIGFYLMTFDVTALRTAERKMAELASHDSLTGLANRRRFDERLPEALARARRLRSGTALLFVDADRFKQINDTHGHAVGDTVLVEFAKRLRSNVRSTDFVARLSGDEFVVILEGVHTEDEAAIAATKLVRAIRQPLQHGELVLSLSASIGVAFLPAGMASDPEALLKLADDALYETKARGRNGHTCLSPAVQEA